MIRLACPTGATVEICCPWRGQATSARPFCEGWTEHVFEVEGDATSVRCTTEVASLETQIVAVPEIPVPLAVVLGIVAILVIADWAAR